MVKGYHVMVGRDNLIFGAGIPGVPGIGSDGIVAGDARLNSSAEVEKSVDEEVKNASVTVVADLVDMEG